MPAEPSITFPPDLPISAHIDELTKLIAENQVVIVAGETGSGKSTQLPKIALAAGRRSIAHTQPRRIAARTIAERIAEEIGEEVGETVGYQVRFTDKVGPNTRLSVMTDGILLNAIHRDRNLERYDTIIIDEAHERSLNIDFLLGYLTTLLPKRPELRVIITSATIDPESFAKHFGGAPIVLVSGRTFPVEVRFRPLDGAADVLDLERDGASSDGQDAVTSAAPIARRSAQVDASAVDAGDMVDGICAAVAELSREPRGDVLVFVSGENDIRDAQAALEGRITAGTLPRDLDVLPLFGRLSNAEQHRVFEPGGRAGRRRVVLATNIAETSLTVPGIRYVVDTGLARISRYSTRSKVQRLPIEAISQASARQRSGRCGRTSDGIAIRLYAEDDFESRPEYTEPEILRTNLASVILQMASLRLGPVEDFPFLTGPDPRGIKDGVDLLRELGAMDAGGRITKLGRELARLPIEPRFGRMIVETRANGNAREVLAIVAGLTIQDVRERPTERREAADQKHARFTDPTSDFLTLLNLWNYLEDKQRELSGSAFRRLCRDEFLNYMRVREWNELYRQLVRMAKSLKIDVGLPAVNPDGIHKSLMSGLLSHLGVRDERSKNPKRPEYRGARGTKFSIFPGSAMARRPPECVMAAELVETSRLFARTVAVIDLAWAEKLAGDRATRSVSEPHWSKRQGAAVAYEKVTLYGLTLVERRVVQFQRFDAAYARELFIRHALVLGEWDSPQAFDKANRKLLRRLGMLEEMSRRRDILRGDEAVYEFYERRIPSEVCSTRSFEGWWKVARREDPDLLTMQESDIVGDGEVALDRAQYPNEWHSDDQRLALSYRFEPGAADDGVTVTVPVALLPRFDQSNFEGSVPGFRLELVTALIKSLPKAIRKNVVPAADYARIFVDELAAAESRADGQALGGITDRLAAVIAARTHMSVTAADFDWERVPGHLRLAFRVVDDSGRTLGSGKDLASLQQRFDEVAKASVARMAAEAAASPASAAAVASPHPAPRRDRGSRPAASSTEGVALAARDDVPGWDVDEIPRSFDVSRGGLQVRAYPAYVVGKAGTVNVRILADRAEQESSHRLGVRRLVARSSPSPAAYIRDHLTQSERLALATAPYRSLDAVIDDVLLAVAGEAIATVSTDGLLWTRIQFEQASTAYSQTVMDSAYHLIATVARVMQGVRDVDVAISAVNSVSLFAPLADVREQVQNLVFAGFVAQTGADRLRRVPVYLAAATARVQRLREDPNRDRIASAEVQVAHELYVAAGGAIPAPEAQPVGLTRVRWMLEELRISVFAQKLGTDGPISLPRIRKALTSLNES